MFKHFRHFFHWALKETTAKRKHCVWPFVGGPTLWWLSKGQQNISFLHLDEENVVNAVMEVIFLEVVINFRYQRRIFTSNRGSHGRTTSGRCQVSSN